MKTITERIEVLEEKVLILDRRLSAEEAIERQKVVANPYVVQIAKEEVVKDE